MKFGIYSDPHFNKKLQYQEQWETSILKTFTEMYKIFVDEKVDIVVCCGDFFDKANLEARNVPIFCKILGIMNDSHLPSYMLLGNHEIDSVDHNILDIVKSEYVHPITTLTVMSPYVMIPYNVPLEEVDSDLIKGKVVFSHHDLYGSMLAGGKTKAAFGTRPDLLKDAQQVFNGHIHLRSTFGNVMNVGSIFSTQFGELLEGSLDSPCYYTYDSVTKTTTVFKNLNSLHYITLSNTESNAVLLENYKELNVPMVLRVMYKEDPDETSYLDLSGTESCTLGTVYRKEVSKEVASTEVLKVANLDIKEIVARYIDQDSTIRNEDKPRVLGKMLKMLGGI